MLDAVAQLAQNILGDISGVLRDEINPDPFGADQPRHLLHLVDQRFRRAVKQQMRLIEKENKTRFVRITDLGQGLEELGQKPQQEGRIKLGRAHQLVGGQDVHLPPPVRIHMKHIFQIKRGLPKERRGALIFQHQQAALDRPDGVRGHKAITQRQCLGVLAHKDQQRLQVLQVQQRQSFLIRHAECDVENPFLRLGQFQQTRQQQRAHFRDRGANGVALLAIKIPEGHGEGFIGEIVKANRARTRHERVMQLVIDRASGSQPRQIAFHIRHEDRHALRRKALGQDLQGDRLARAGGPGNQPVAIGIFEQHMLLFAVAVTAAAHENTFTVGHGRLPLHNNLGSEHTLLTRACQYDRIAAGPGLRACRRLPPCRLAVSS